LEIARFRTALRAHRRVALDTCIFIYQWEANPLYSPFTDWIFASLEQSELRAATSTITMTELLVHPYREGDSVRVSELFGLLSSYPNLEWVAPDLHIAARAAEIRGLYRMETPDALQAATALLSNSTALLTNDSVFKRVSELDVLIIDEYL
jgi:predicted nucleic acid-binding protein